MAKSIVFKATDIAYNGSNSHRSDAKFDFTTVVKIYSKSKRSSALAEARGNAAVAN